MDRKTVKHLAIVLLSGAALALGAGCAGKKPYHVRFEKRRLHGVGGSGLRSSNQAAQPIAVDDALLIGTRGGALVALDERSGLGRWRLSVGEGFEAPAVWADGVLFITDIDGTCRAIDPRTRKVLWSYEIGAEMFGAPVLVDNLLVMATQENRVVALERESGTFVWQYRHEESAALSIRGLSQPAYAAGRLFVGFSDGNLVALNAKTGKKLWQRPVGESSNYRDVDTTPLVVTTGGASQIVVAGYNGPAAAYNLEGRLRWVNDTVKTQSAPLLFKETLYVAAVDGTLYALQVTDGKVLWRTPFGRQGGSVAASTPLALGDHLVFGTSQGDVMVVDRTKGDLIWRYNIGRRVSGAVLASKAGFCAMNGQETLFCFNPN